MEPFGSFTSNLFTRWGDLDISIELQNVSHIASLGKKHKLNLLRDVLGALRKKSKPLLLKPLAFSVLKVSCFYFINICFFPAIYVGARNRFFVGDAKSLLPLTYYAK